MLSAPARSRLRAQRQAIEAHDNVPLPQTKGDEGKAARHRQMRPETASIEMDVTPSVPADRNAVTLRHTALGPKTACRASLLQRRMQCLDLLGRPVFDYRRASAKRIRSSSGQRQVCTENHKSAFRIASRVPRLAHEYSKASKGPIHTALVDLTRAKPGVRQSTRRLTQSHRSVKNRKTQRCISAVLQHVVVFQDFEARVE